jgi:hypothetical protein
MDGPMQTNSLSVRWHGSAKDQRRELGTITPSHDEIPKHGMSEAAVRLTLLLGDGRVQDIFQWVREQVV